MRKNIIRTLLFLLIIVCTYSQEVTDKKAYAVLPFSKYGNVNEEFIKGIIFKIEHFLNSEGVVITSRAKIMEIIEEKKLGISGISDQQSKEIGQILAAHFIITGFIERRSGKYMITVQKISVETGRVEDSYFVETSPEDVFFTKSAEYLAKKLTGANIKESSIFKEESSVIEIKNNKVKVKKINVNYLDKDRYDARYIIIDCFGKAYTIKGELYINGEVFDIYQIKGEKYPKTTEDIVYLMPLENRALLTDGTTKKIMEELNSGYVKDENGRKYFIKNAKAVAWENRVNNTLEFLANYNANIETVIEKKSSLKPKIYNIETGKITPNTKDIIESDKIKIKAANFEGEIDKDEIVYIIPSFYRIKLKNGFSIMFFSDEFLGSDYLYDDQKKIEFDVIGGYEEAVIEEIKQTLHSGNLDDPFYFDEIKENKVRSKFKDYYTNRRTDLFSREEMSIDGMEITDLSFLKGFLFLERLKANNNKIKEIRTITLFKALSYLEINNNEISDVSELVKLKKLKTLEISNNKIKNLEQFTEFVELRDLKVSKNRIFDIEPLAKLTDLEEIDLSNTRISSLSGIANLTKMRKIDISNNKLLLEIDGVKAMNKLNYINICNTNVEDISPLGGKIELASVVMANTLVTNIETLKKVKFLSFLNLTGNSINCRDLSDWSFTDKLKVWNGSYLVDVSEKEKINFGILNGAIVKNY